uniref:Uncharacterized protein n=1 Tax=Glossina pallidipes TaxID=7398 RepID=A0A1B0A3S3_GLOPL
MYDITKTIAVLKRLRKFSPVAANDIEAVSNSSLHYGGNNLYKTLYIDPFCCGVESHFYRHHLFTYYHKLHAFMSRHHYFNIWILSTIFVNLSVCMLIINYIRIKIKELPVKEIAYLVH